MFIGSQSNLVWGPANIFGFKPDLDLKYRPVYNSDWTWCLCLLLDLLFVVDVRLFWLEAGMRELKGHGPT